jgi:hypothetical protein
MKLTAETITQGRNPCRAHDLDGLMKWFGKNVPMTDQDMIRRTFELCFRVKDTAKALKILAAFDNYDKAKEVRCVLLVCCVIVVVIVCLFGGAFALFKALT